MKKNLVALMLGFVSIVFFGCSSNSTKTPSEESTLPNGSLAMISTENYMNTKSKTLATATMISSTLGENVKVNIELINWNDTPVDTITMAMIYDCKAYLADYDVIHYKSCVSLAEQNVETCKDLVSFDASYKKNLNEARALLSKEKKNYQIAKHTVDSIKNLITSASNKDSIVYLVYMFNEQITYKHPVSNTKITNDYVCFSFINAATQEVAKVSENVRLYERKLEDIVKYYNPNFQ